MKLPCSLVLVLFCVIQLSVACGDDNKSIVLLKQILSKIPAKVKAQLKQVYVVAFTAINEMVSIRHLYEKCGGKCANFLISALAIILTHAQNGTDYCRQNDTNNKDCLPNVYMFANHSVQNLEPVAVTCLNSIGIEVNATESKHIVDSIYNAVIDGVKAAEENNNVTPKAPEEIDESKVSIKIGSEEIGDTEEIKEDELISGTTANSTVESKTAETPPKPVETTPKSGETTPKSVETTSKSVETTPKSIETTPKSGEPTPKSFETTPKSVETTPKSVETTPKSVETTPKSVETTPKSVETTPKSVETTPKSVETTPKSVETTPKSTRF